MKFTLHHQKPPSSYWNGLKELPTEIHVISYDPYIAEFELFTMICSLHGSISVFDILTGANTGSEKDEDMEAIMTAFQMYMYPKMPISNYGADDKRMKSNSFSKVQPIDPDVYTT